MFTICRYILLWSFPVVLLSGELIQASVVTQPTSLSPGDQYRLAFVTSTIAEASSTDIDVYNAYVSAVANGEVDLASLGTVWRVIGGTTTISARQNTGTDPTPAGPTGVPIFLLNDTRIAASYDDLWDGTLERDFNITEDGSVLDLATTNSGRVWTGSGNAGTLAVQALGADSPIYGNSKTSAGTTNPVDPGFNGWMLDWAIGKTARNSFYAISGVLTVPGTPGVVPEATSILVWGGLAMTAAVGALRRRGSCVAP